MKITLESTQLIDERDDAPCRIWRGKTHAGATVVCFIAAIATPLNEITATAMIEMELRPLGRELIDQRAMSVFR